MTVFPIPLVQNKALIQRHAIQKYVGAIDADFPHAKIGFYSIDRLAPAQQPVTAEQMRMQTEDTGYFSILINNGRILRDNLRRMGRDERWLQKQVQQRGVQCIEGVYLLMMNDAGQIYFAAKELR